MLFKVQWKYSSSLGGPFLAGDTVELGEAMAEAINRDSPGVLVAVNPKKAGKPVGEKTIKDRAVRQAETRGRSQGEVMTSDNFAAVKPKEE
jgi:hypothetical protein